jgi:hypothetical protein
MHFAIWLPKRASTINLFETSIIFIWEKTLNMETGNGYDSRLPIEMNRQELPSGTRPRDSGECPIKMDQGLWTIRSGDWPAAIGHSKMPETLFNRESRAVKIEKAAILKISWNWITHISRWLRCPVSRLRGLVAANVAVKGRVHAAYVLPDMKLRRHFIFRAKSDQNT